MKQNSKFLALAAALAVTISSAHATITLSFEAQVLLQGGSGSNPAAAGSLVLLVADTTGGGFGALKSGPITVGSLINQSGNDLVVGQFSVSASSFLTSNQPSLDVSQPFTLSGAWDAGDPLAIYWIPSDTTANTAVGSGVAFGEYTDATGLNGSAAWITPSDGSTAGTMLFSTINGGAFGSGSVPASAGYASQLTVPEPSTYALLGGLVGLTAAALRRRKASATPVA